jgi:GNAT superfamily N-acetyltransferase
MANDPNDGRPYRSTVRRAALAEVHDAVAIVREAATWAAARGIEVWGPREIREEAFEASARKAELLIGFADQTPAATMLLQTEDPIYWPNETPASALYLHKVAIRRSFAGQGWLARLIDFAVVEANSAGIPRLRLDTILRPKLRSMYEQHGFGMLDEEPLLVYGRQMIRMERLLRT